MIDRSVYFPDSNILQVSFKNADINDLPWSVNKVDPVPEEGSEEYSIARVSAVM